MRKLLFFFFLFQLLMVPFVFSQTAKIVFLKGEVWIKKTEVVKWEKANLDMPVEKNTQIRIEKDSECTIAFDEELKDIFTIKQNSQVTLENIKPAYMHLPKGKVFALVEDVKKVEEFKIRTPTAVAGVRGTGESVESSEDSTTAMCFEEMIYLQGLDEQGRATGERVLNEGFGIVVGAGGIFGEMFGLTDEDYRQWQEFSDSIRDLRHTRQGPKAETEGIGEEDVGDLKEEAKESFREDTLEERRALEELREKEKEPRGGEY